MMNTASCWHMDISRLLLVALVVTLCAFSAGAQSYIYDVGDPTYATTSPVELGYVDLSNGTLHLEVPLYSSAQRGKVPFSAKLVYDSRIWHTVFTSTEIWKPTNVVDSQGQPSQGGWRVITSGDIGMVTYGGPTSVDCIPGSNQNYYSQYGPFVWTDPTGVQHTFPITTKSSSICSNVPTGSANATDSTGLLMSVTNYTQATVYSKDGTELYPQVEDTNGNYFSSTVDTLGRTPMSKTVSGNVTTYKVLTSQTTSPSSPITVTTTNLTVTTAFGQANVAECVNCTITVVSSIGLPDGTAYTFGYDTYGLIKSITLPTGGTVTYTHSNFSDAYGDINRWVTARSSAGGQWSYSPSVVSTCGSGQVGCQQRVTVTQPSHDTQVYTFTLNNGAWKNEIDFYNGAASPSNLVQSSISTYDFSNACTPTPCSGASYITKLAEVQSLPSAGNTVAKRTEYSYDSSAAANITEIREWKYFTGSTPSTPDRKTDITYDTNTSYTNKNILDLPLSIVVKTGSGTWLSQTNFTYDSTALITAGATGVAGHDDSNFGSGDTVRGNLTVVDRFVSSGASCPSVTCLETSTSYDITGQERQITDPKGNTTTLSYTDRFYTDNGANPPSGYTPPSATNAFVTQVTLPLTGTITYGYYFGSGKRASTTDQNGADSYAHFDIYDRPSTQYGPPVATGGRGWILAQYPSGTQTQVFSSIGSATASSTCASCTESEMDVDSFGRPVTNTLLSDPDGNTTVNTTYDSSGRTQSVTNPYRSTTDNTYGSTSMTYDGLNRVSGVTYADNSAVNAYYGAAIAAQGGQSVQQCPASTCGTGYPILYIDPAGKKRQTWLDGFGKIIEVDEPQLGATAATGSVIIGGSEQSKAIAAVPGKGTFYVYGTEKQVYFCPAACFYTWDSGTVSVSVNGGSPITLSFGQNSTSTGLTQSLAADVNGSSLVTAVYNSSTFAADVTARTAGANTNYPLSGSSASSLHPAPSGSPSFHVSTSGLSGGANGYTQYDTGSVWITLNGTQYKVNYGQGSTAASVAAALQTAMAGASVPVTVTLSGSKLSFTAKSTGSGGNYSLSVGSSTAQPGTFASPSFTASASGTSLTGGADAGSLTWPIVTYYVYDALGNLTQVVQGVESRSLTYDALSRVTSYTAPESGTKYINYATASNALCSGDASSVCWTKDARNITATNTYDSLNRLTNTSYSDGTKPVYYYYDQSSYDGLAITNGIGRLTGMSDGSGESAWSYDLRGNVLTQRQTISTISKNISYSYNLDGSLASITYPDGRVVNATYSNAGRMVAFADSAHDFVQSVAYAPQGAVASAVYGYSTSFAGVTLTYAYNNRLQQTSEVVSSSAGSVLNLAASFPSGSNNGEISSVADNITAGNTQTYTYDVLHRVSSAQTQATTGNCWGQSFGYDQWGNLLQATIKQCSGSALSVSATNNRLTGFGYDLAGDMTSDGANSYIYDASGNLVSGAGMTYGYNGLDLRVSKSSGTLYWRDILGNTIEETDSSGNANSDYIFFNGMRVARIDMASGQAYYYFSDHLGSTRAITTDTGTVCYRADYTPYGGEVVYSNTCPQNYKFTGYERDSETGLDYAMFRMYSSNLRRFMQPDPLELRGSDTNNPQSLNSYLYVIDNPISLNDPAGLCNPEIANDPTCYLQTQQLWLTMSNFGCWFTGLCNVQPPQKTGGGSGTATANNATPQQQQCLATVQGDVNSQLGTNSLYLGPTTGPGIDANGMRGGAYNYNFFAPNVIFIMPKGANSVPKAYCGRFSDGLHVPVPYWPCNFSGDPTISNWGPGFYNGLQGSFLTAHIDSSNPFQDLYSLFAHLINNVILQRKHGC